LFLRRHFKNCHHALIGRHVQELSDLQIGVVTRLMTSQFTGVTLAYSSVGVSGLLLTIFFALVAIQLGLVNGAL
jgi:hypothetical protein